MSLINFNDFDTAKFEQTINKALMVKNAPEKFNNSLQGKKMYMLFQKTSTRTALSFGLGMNELGGIYFLQNWEDSNFTVGEIQDEVRYIGRNVDVIMARLKENRDICLMAQYSTIPVINGCCNRFHPCQALADLLTIKENFGRFDIKLLYIGIANNVFNSLAESLPKLGGQLIAVTPIVNEPSRDNTLIDVAKKSGNFTEINCLGLTQNELRDIIADVDIIYTDTWVDMEFFNDKRFEKKKNDRVNTMLPFQVNDDLLAKSKAIVMHDMPMHTGYEITREVIEKHKNTIFQQAENRRHAQKAILLDLLERK